MPFYDETLTEDDLKRMVDGYKCNECGNILTIAWGGYWKINGYVLRCSNPEHSTIAPKRSAIKHKESYEENIRREYQMEQELGREKSRALATIPRTGQLTQSQAMHILKLVYPRAPEDEIIRCAILCRDFGLHPLMKEVYIIGFKNRKTGQVEYSTVIGISASRKMAADRKGAYSFVDDSPRAATHKEIVKQFGEDSEEEKANLISICKVRGKDGNEAIGFGLWPREEEPYGTNKGNTKRNMTNIRSERQALSRLPGEALPQVEVIDEVYAEVPVVKVVDTITGEITEQLTKPEPPPAEPEEIASAEETTATLPAEPPPVPTKSKPEAVNSGTLLPASGIPSTTEALLAWVCEVKGFGTAKTAREWLMKVCKITSQRLTEDPAGVYQEAKQLLGK